MAALVHVETNPVKIMWSNLQTIEVDQVGLLASAVELVQGVTLRTRKQAQDVLYELTSRSDVSYEKREKAATLLARTGPFPGFMKDTPLITFKEGMQLIRLLPGKYTAHIIEHIDDTFQSVEGGDPRIHVRVAQNAASDSAVAQLARDGITDMPQAIVITEEERALKKRKLELEIESMEMNINERQAAVDKATIEFIENQGRLLAQFCGGKLEARDSLELADRVRNVNNNNKKTKLITHKGEQYTITVSARCHARGFTKFKTKDWKAVGKIAGRKYRERAIARGETDPEKLKPPKHTQEATGGNVRSVNTYMAPDDLSLIDEAIDEYVASMLDADDE